MRQVSKPFFLNRLVQIVRRKRLPISFRLTGPHFVCLYSLDCPLWLSSINLTVSQMTKLCLQEFQFAVKFFNFLFGKQSKVRCINDFNNISVILWLSVLLVEETGVPREMHWPTTSHRQTWSHNAVSRFELTTLVVIGTNCIGSYAFNYHTITTMVLY